MARTKKATEAPIDRLEAMLKTSPKDAEALALVGTIYGQQAGRSMMRAIVLGPRSTGALERAADVESANPRVLLLQGITALHTPSVFGGSRDKAEHLLRRSLDEFSREPGTKAWPNWGRFDAHAWLGQVPPCPLFHRVPVIRHSVLPY